MKRSKVNQIIKDAIKIAEDHKIPLPRFAYWTPDEWKKISEKDREVMDNMLGWDVTDFASGDFDKIGLTIFTFRNGNFNNKELYSKPYAEKMLLVNDGQTLPFHFHWSKMEDIINRGGGDLRITLYNSDENEDFADSDVEITIDGRKVVVEAGGTVVLKSGESITLKPGQYHSWQGVPGTGTVVLFEVSTTNDDTVDNRFHTAIGRIPTIEEDVAPEYLIFNDYASYAPFN